MEKIRTKTGISYKEKVYINGRTITKTFKRKSDALRWKQKAMAERDYNAAVGIALRDNLIMDKFIEKWFVEKSDLAQRSVDNYRCIYRAHIGPVIGNKELRSIKIADGQEIKFKALNAGLAPVRINLVIRMLKQLFNDAVKWEYLMRNPLKQLESMSEPLKDIPYWLPDEIERFLSANINDEHYELYLVALNTGMRRGELLGLCWDKVDFKRRMIEISRTLDRYGLKETTKTKRSRNIPMNDVVFRALERLQDERRSRKFVFVKRDGSQINIRHFSDRPFHRAMEKAGVKRIPFKNLRTTFASNYCMQGGDIFTLSKVLGHTRVEMTSDRYAHLHPGHLLEASNVVNFGAFSKKLSAC